MVFRSFVDPATDATIEQALRDAFATRKTLGTTLDLEFERDTEEGEPFTFIVRGVLVSFAAREPARVSGNAATYMGADGQLERETPFPVAKGDRFRLPPNPGSDRGQAGYITIILPEEADVVRALFTLQG